MRPSPRLTLERIDNDGNYEPGNVRWATRTEQNRNKRETLWLTYRGKRLPLKEWAERTGVKYYTLRSRLAKGWGKGRALDPHAKPPPIWL
jgi:hypothetical protein